jgi:hypothetical protein
MNCFCCGRSVAIARKVKIRRLLEFEERQGGPDSAAYKAYLEETTYRWGIVCPACYLALDNEVGAAEIDGRFFTIAGTSRHDRARAMDEEQYLTWQRKEAEKLGISSS